MRSTTEVKPEMVGGKALQDAVTQAALQAVMPDGVDEDAIEAAVKAAEKRKASPKNGVTPPATGRPKGVRNKLTSLRDAVIEAFDEVGGVKYLVKLANGTQSDRAAFVSLMNKVLPTQINQQVEGGVRLELSWLGTRAIGTSAAQGGTDATEKHTQVLDLERDDSGKYRIRDQEHEERGGV
jgi:hypothetical protein